jgi:hypothetical protein
MITHRMIIVLISITLIDFNTCSKDSCIPEKYKPVAVQKSAYRYVYLRPLPELWPTQVTKSHVLSHYKLDT